jgi:DnaK suppressor protein
MEKVNLPEGYKPSEAEEYMNDVQLEYFKCKLLRWKQSLQEESNQAVEFLKKKNWKDPDISDRASDEVDVSIELRTQDRYRKLIAKIDAALDRVKQGEYGYCEDSGEPIGLGRLEARPIATFCIEAQEKHERFEKTHNEE